MAYLLTYWADDNSKGQVGISEHRLKSIDEVPSFLPPNQMPTDTVLVTVDRTDNQSPVEKIVWVHKGYEQFI